MASSDLPNRRDILQKRMGPFPVVLIETFQNWGKTQSMKVLSVKPKNVDEVIRVVKAANFLRDDNVNFTIRCVGDGHSWSPLFPDPGNILMYTADLIPRSGERIQLNEDDFTVTIAPGVTTGELSDYFLKNNVCIKSDVVLSEVTYGGTVATGCHGVGKGEMAISDKVAGMTLVEANGDIKTYDFTKPPDASDLYYNALKCNLGLLGVMTDLTLKVEPMVIVKVENDFSLSVGDVFYNPSKLKQLYAENWSLEIFWFPFNSLEWGQILKIAALPWIAKLTKWDPMKDKVWIRKINVAEVPDGPCPTATDYAYKSGEDLISTTFGRLLTEQLNETPSLVPSFLKAGFQMIKLFNGGPPKFELMNKAIHYQGFVDSFPVLDMEFAFNMDKDFVDQAKAMQFVVEESKELFSSWKPQFPLSLAMEMRWMASSEALMCPARAASNVAEGGSGKTFYLEVLGVAGQPDNIWENFTTDVASKWMGICPGGKAPVPHWAKQWSYIPNICAHIQKAYGPKVLKEFTVLSRPNAPAFMNQTLKKAIFEEAKVERVKPKPKSAPVAKPSVLKNIPRPEELQIDPETVQKWVDAWMSLAERTWIPRAHANPKIRFQLILQRVSGLVEQLQENLGSRSRTVVPSKS